MPMPPKAGDDAPIRDDPPEAPAPQPSPAKTAGATKKAPTVKKAPAPKKTAVKPVAAKAAPKPPATPPRPKSPAPTPSPAGAGSTRPRRTAMPAAKKDPDELLDEAMVNVGAALAAIAERDKAKDERKAQAAAAAATLAAHYSGTPLPAPAGTGPSATPAAEELTGIHPVVSASGVWAKDMGKELWADGLPYAPGLVVCDCHDPDSGKFKVVPADSHNPSTASGTPWRKLGELLSTKPPSRRR